MYTLEEWDGVDRPYVIRRPTGEVLFTMSEHDRSFSESILAALNSGEALSSGIVLPEFAGRSDITTFEYADALCDLRSDRETISGG